MVLLARETSFDVCYAHVQNGECRTVYYCWSCGTQPFRGPHVPRDPDATAARIHVGELEARWAVVFAAMAERPGQRPKSKIADDFDAFLLARSGRGRGWTTATDDMSSTGRVLSILGAMGLCGCAIGLVRV